MVDVSPGVCTSRASVEEVKQQLHLGLSDRVLDSARRTVARHDTEPGRNRDEISQHHGARDDKPDGLREVHGLVNLRSARPPRRPCCGDREDARLPPLRIGDGPPEKAGHAGGLACLDSFLDRGEPHSSTMFLPPSEGYAGDADRCQPKYVRPVESDDEARIRSQYPSEAWQAAGYVDQRREAKARTKR